MTCKISGIKPPKVNAHFSVPPPISIVTNDVSKGDAFDLLIEDNTGRG